MLEQEKNSVVIGRRLSEWVNVHYRSITVAVLLLAVLMAGSFSAFGSDEEPEFDPSGRFHQAKILHFRASARQLRCFEAGFKKILASKNVIDK